MSKTTKNNRYKKRVKSGLGNPLTPAREFLKQFDLSSMLRTSAELERSFIIHCGPTNSGKTYDALQALKNAKTGAYLGPLRLLALEVYDTLNADNVPCSLVTGEEIIYTDNAGIVASTIEMCNYNKRYDVAVIDEAQLIADNVRGGNWLKALLLINAKEVHVCTAPEALPVIESLLKQTNTKYRVVSHKRLTPLVFSGEMTSIKKVQPGDALITFSRKGVLSIAAALEDLGIKASVIYGALPPTSRREEVRRFVEGETSVVIATDAIGMGVSLPIKRVIFCATSKFNGTEVCNLTTSEIKQIAGRAGRYGKYDVGEVLTFKNSYLIKDALSAETPKINKLTMPFPEQAIDSDFSLPILLKAWNTLPKEKTFVRVDMSESFSLYGNLPDSALSIDKKDMYSFICCPVDQKSPVLVNYWRDCCAAIIEGRELPQPDFGDETLESCELKYRAYDIKHQMARRAGCEDDSLIEKEKLCKKINAFLRKSKSAFLSRCSVCNKKLPIDYPYGMCQKCFINRYWY